MRILAALVVVLLAARADASPLACPVGTQAKSSHDGSITQEWCARPNGTRHGPYRSASGGVKASEGQYVDGKQDGLWSSWQANGKPFEQVHYARGIKDGTWIAWNSNGVMLVRGDYRQGREHGTWTWWHYNGKQKAVTTYVEGVAEGHASEWDETGKLTSDGDYAAGKRVGKWLDEGARGAYCADRRCGHWELLDEAGRVYASGDYRDGAREGVWTEFFDGKRIARAMYVRGQKHGHVERWDLDSGKKILDLECRHGQPHGTRREWLANGEVRAVVYDGGEAGDAWIEACQGDELSGESDEPPNT